MRILSGVQSSGRLHIGNYYGAIHQFVQLQEEGEALYFIATHHALTTVREAAKLREFTREAAIAYLALGLDPKRAILFRQGDVAEIFELYWILGSVVPHAHLERAHSYKDKVARGMAPDFGLFAYPILMAADILLYGTDVVPVGRDQVQHIEFARDWATRFNVTYVPGYDPQDPEGREKGHVPGVLKLPTFKLREETAVVPGIDGQKMSKSYSNTIDLFADDKEVKKRIMSIKTDSTPVESPKPLEDAPLYDLLKLMAPPGDFAVIDEAWRRGGSGYGDFKKKLLEIFHGTFGPARKRREELMAHPEEVEAVLRDGAERARRIALPIMKRVRESVGL